MRSKWFTLLRLAVLVALVTAFLLPPGNPDVRAQQPTTAVDPGPGTEYLMPALWALLQRHTNGDATVPTTLDVRLAYSLEHEAVVQQAITAAGGTDATTRCASPRIGCWPSSAWELGPFLNIASISSWECFSASSRRISA